jgi:hypothetical protein
VDICPVQIKVCHFNISLVLLWACGIIANKVFHRFIGTRLVEAYGAIGAVIAAIGLYFRGFCFQLLLYQKSVVPINTACSYRAKPPCHNPEFVRIDRRFLGKTLTEQQKKQEKKTG